MIKCEFKIQIHYLCAMSHSNTNIKVFVIHVRDQEERKRFIEPQLKALGIPYEYILDGNMEDLTPEVIDRYFAVGGEADTMHGVYPRTSCTYKAFLAYKRIVDDRLDGALIFEDDIQLFSDFRQKFEDTLDEINRTHQHTPLLANYEESSLLLVPRSIRRKGQYLYEMPRDRFAGCYYINNEAAQVIERTQIRERQCTSCASDGNIDGEGRSNIIFGAIPVWLCNAVVMPPFPL